MKITKLFLSQPPLKGNDSFEMQQYQGVMGAICNCVHFLSFCKHI